MRFRGAGSPAGRRRQHGFTLIELLVVLAVIALVAAVVPGLVAGVPGVRLRAAADGMVATLRELHGEAIRRGRVTELVLDPAARTYRVSTDPTRRVLPAVVGAVAFKSAALMRPTGPATIRFFADGSASGGTIVLRHGRSSAAVTVDWLTGRVRADD